MNSSPVVFFDGVCNFCNSWVNFAIRRDRHSKLRFSPLQGENAKLLAKDFLKTDSVLVLDKEKLYTYSSAALRICLYLDGGWKLLYAFMIVPKFIRDFFYRIVARNRYKWFGKKDQCMIPSPELKSRFLP